MVAWDARCGMRDVGAPLTAGRRSHQRCNGMRDTMRGVRFFSVRGNYLESSFIIIPGATPGGVVGLISKQCIR